MTSNSDSQATITRIYSPLDSSRRQIRVLQLQSGHYEDVVKGTFLVTQLSGRQVRANAGSNVLYEATSYTWSDSNVKVSLLLNGQNFEAPASVVHALRALRSPTMRQKFWIDALCINQDDLDERSQQVAIMGDIYRSSSLTRIWLGAENALSASALSFCKDIRDEVAALLASRGSLILDRWDEVSSRMRPEEGFEYYKILVDAINSVPQRQPPSVAWMINIFSRP